MKRVPVAFLALLLSWGGFSFGAPDSVICTASGKSVSVKGGGLVEGKAKLTFDETTNEDGLRVLKAINGKIETANSLGDEGYDYVGYFKLASLTENPDYHPHKYVGYSQFQNFDAADTTGSQEDGMWGQFVLEKDTSRAKFSAHYIFQAGDHMGGVLHLTCRYQ